MVSFNLRSRHWIVNEKGGIIMGDGRKEILESIEKTGSINQTAKDMKMSYRGVWSRIKATEKYLNKKIVEADKKRGTHLTREGKELLERYTRLKEQCIQSDDRIFNAIFRQD